MRKVIVACILLAVGSSVAFAEATPPRTKLDPRVREAKYTDGQVYTVNVSFTRATTIEFAPGERIASIVAGDTKAFKFQSVPGDRVFAIKPLVSGAVTNVTVYTNMRSYYFRLVERKKAFYVVRFTYPGSRKNSARSTKRFASSSTYGVNTKNAITPTRIWDDGTFTYFRFRRNAPIPAIFKVVGGKERTVNSTKIDGRTMRVSGVSRQWALRSGKIEVCIAELTDG